jgi:hypothetical protein
MMEKHKARTVGGQEHFRFIFGSGNLRWKYGTVSPHDPRFPTLQKKQLMYIRIKQ